MKNDHISLIKFGMSKSEYNSENITLSFHMVQFENEIIPEENEESTQKVEEGKISM